MTRKPAPPEGGQPDQAAPPAQASASAQAPATRPGAAAETVTGLLGAGFQALKVVHDDMRARRSRVFAALLGVEPGHPEAGSTPAESAAEAGPRHFDSVFDQRVAESLQRLGYPPPEVFVALVELLSAQLPAQGFDEAAAAPKNPAASGKSGSKDRSSREARHAPDPKT